MSKANDRQEGGDHYRATPGEQHWDRIIRLYPEHAYVYFVAAITKYVERYRRKNGVEDLRKARHYLDKLIELEESAARAAEGRLNSRVYDAVRERAISASPKPNYP